jgi:hypothetical protein
MKERDYKKEYEWQSSPLQKARRARRNAARRAALKAGKVRKGDGKDVGHIRPNKKGNLSNAPSNLRVEDRSENRARK